MKKEIIPEADGDRTVAGSKGSSQRLLLLVLLLLVVVFGYLYYFTGLIRPREEAKTPEVQTAKIRQPLPPRPDQGGTTAVTPAKPEEKPQPQAKAENPAPAQPQPKPAPAAPSKTEAAPAAKPATPPAAKPQPVAKAKTEPAPMPKQAATPVAKPKAVSPQPAPVKVAKAEAPGGKKEQAQAHPATARKTKSQQKVETKPPVKTVATAKKTAGPANAASHQTKPAMGKGAYTLLIGEFAIDRDVHSNKARLKKLGISDVKGMKATKPVTMHRLFLAEFDSHYAADQELQKLNKAAGSAFILEEKGKFSVYAGSYLRQKGAAAEQRRLAGKGFNLGIKAAKVMMPLTRLTAGSYASSAEADKEASRLKNHGMTAKVVKIGA